MISIKVPPLGESIVEATISRWLKKEGDAVAQNESLVELETDKITVEVPAFKAGVLVKLNKKEGDVVQVGEEIGEIDESASGAATSTAAAAPSAAKTAAPTAPAVAPIAAPAPKPAPAPVAAPSATAGASPPKTSPAVRRIAADEGIDPATVAASGPGGRVTKGDILAAASAAPVAKAPAPAPSKASGPPAPSLSSQNGRETRERMTTRRRRIAEHLLESQHATAHLTTFNEVDMSAVSTVRDRLRERIEKEHGVKLTYMPFFAKAASLALKAYPAVNAQIDGDSVIYKHYVNLGIAVAADNGLVVPVVKDADQMSMLDFSRALTAVAKRARDGALTMDDLTGGSFTITNGGVFGSLVSTPILNYPQVAILGLHKIQDRPVAIAGKVEIRPMMYLALSYDHRLVDGQQAVLFLVRIKELIEDPAAMLVE
ncbi:MAG: 2-oxoglutarate dehydrogenase complex dihydrolipoyllysine-residue succinyltransferase [Gemmatimonadota bacterium]|nr:2-oxoglutarate dehydrogenase complex dihydrolipoyllysine-residue succinyltransferase [Gemmatimonadota bacterium]